MTLFVSVTSLTTIKPCNSFNYSSPEYYNMEKTEVDKLDCNYFYNPSACSAGLQGESCSSCCYDSELTGFTHIG